MTLTLRGLRAPRCQLKKQSPTHYAVVVSANARLRDGNLSRLPNSTSSASSAKDCPTRTSPQGCSCHRARCSRICATSTKSSDCLPASNSQEKPPATKARTDAKSPEHTACRGTLRLLGRLAVRWPVATALEHIPPAATRPLCRARRLDLRHIFRRHRLRFRRGSDR